MTKIPLEYPIWSRLYGPYGVGDVPSKLQELEKEWDEDIANDLFWNELHHQGDLYPVTFAAMPWLWDIVHRLPALPREALVFFSCALRCAVAPYGTGCDGQGPKGKYRGLSLSQNDHTHSWIPTELRLNKDDMHNLSKLENWFAANAPRIGQTCLSEIDPKDIWETAALAQGALAMDGGDNVAQALTLWADGCSMQDVMEDIPQTAEDARIALDFASVLRAKSPEASQFLREYSRNKPLSG